MTVEDLGTDALEARAAKQHEQEKHCQRCTVDLDKESVGRFVPSRVLFTGGLRLPGFMNEPSVKRPSSLLWL